MIKQNKKGAMEMSVGTIVTIVLLMSVLVLGIFLVQRIFSSSTSAIDTVDSQIQSEINKLFAAEGKAIVIYPSSQEITLKKGDDPKGFAFSVKNEDVESHDYTFTVEAADTTGCGSLTVEDASSWLRPSQGSFSLGPGDSMVLAQKVLFAIPSTAPPCLVTFNLRVTSEDDSFRQGGQIFVTVK